MDLLECRTLLSGSSDAVGGPYTVPADPRATLNLDAGWKFIRSDVSGAQATNFNDSAWTGVNVPHTWNAVDGEDGGSNYYRGVGWYRRSVTVPTSMTGDTIHVRFEGSSIATSLYVDGTLIGSHAGAFGAFDFDLTSALASGGTHVFAVKVDNSDNSYNVAPQSGDFTFFGGIYRDVSLLGVSPQHISVDDYASSGVYFTSPTVSSASASVAVRTGLTNSATTSRTLLIHTVLADQTGTIVGEMSTTQTLAAGANASVSQTTTVTNPHLWNGRIDPYLHELYVEVRDATTGTLIDLIHQRVGIRFYAISPTQGFLLNGVPYNLHGASLHQDRQDEGWAISDADITQDVGFFIDIGATALRTAHYEQNQLLYDLCDAAGIIVYTEVPNVGSSNGGQIPTGATFLANVQQQLKELIRQSYNHASIVVWGVYNEVSNTTDNRTFVSNLSALAHSEDPSRLTVGASNTYLMTDLERTTDVVAFNRYYGWYYGTPSDFAGQLDYLHQQTPAIDVGVSEYGAGASIYQHQDNATIPQYDGPFHPEEYQATFHEQSWAVLKARPWIWGTFVWNMFDFAVDSRNEGDTAGRNDKGLVTYDRKTKKDAYYFYKANWSSDPLVYITSRRFTERTSPTTKVKIYSNVDNPTLIVNGVSVALTNNGNDVWTSPTITLINGNNVVSVTGTRNGQAVSDSVTWHYSTGTPPTDANAHIDFQPSGGTTGTGYVADTGLIFGTRSNGAQFGWNLDNSANTRRRGMNADPRLDTIIHMQLGGTYSWEYALANGTYDVTIGAGDPSFTDSVNNLNVEGTQVVDTDGQDNFDTFTVRVTVSDGRLTVAPGTNALNAKLDYIDIVAVVTTPAAPTSLAMLGATSSSIALAWTDNASNETGFLIEQQNADGTWAQIGTTLANVTTFTVSGLLASTTYSFRVRATNAAGQSVYSNTLVAGTTTAAPVPAAPTSLVASATTSASITLSWSDNASNETGFLIERQNSDSSWAQIGTSDANVTTYTVNGLASLSTYTFRVRATNASGNSGYSNTLTVATPDVPVSDGYTSVDIGSPLTTGTTTIVTAGTDYDITASGTDVWAGSDQLRFVYKSITGDFDYSARVAGLTAIDSNSMAGLMARESIDPASRNIFMRARALNDLAATYRLATGGSTDGLSALAVTFPNAYVRLKRVGNVFSAYGSADGVNWTLATQQTIAMPATVLLGMAVSAHTTTTATTTANIRQLTNLGNIAVPATPSNLTATPSASPQSIALSWIDNATTETGYRVERRLSGSSTWSVLTTLGANAASFVDATAVLNTTYVYRVFATNSAGDSVASAEVSATIVHPAPMVLASTFAFETGHSIAIDFSGPMDSTTITASDLVVTQAGNGTTFAPTSVTYDATTNRATFTFATPLPDGTYAASLAAGSVADSAGVTLATPFTSSTFFVLAGDANRDRKVDFSDLVILAQNYNATGKTFSQGNFDYSANGTVDFSDLVILAQRYGQMPSLSAALAKSSAPTPAKKRAGLAELE